MRTGTEVDAREPVLARIDGWGVNLSTLDEAVLRIADAAAAGDGFAVNTLNLDHLVKLRQSPAFSRAYRAARFVTADGAPVARLARRQHAGIERTTGADLLVPLAMEAARRGLPVYLYGTTAEVIGRAGRDLSERCDGALDIVGSAAPSANFDPEGREADAAIKAIRASGARLCFLALGAPKQEILAARAVASGVPCGFVSIGASLDFIAGKQIRAPEVMQKNGLEWLWRLASNPRRLGWRYAQCAMLLADLTLLGPVRDRMAGPRA